MNHTTFAGIMQKYAPLIERLRPYAGEDFEDFSQFAWMRLYDVDVLAKWEASDRKKTFREYMGSTVHNLWHEFRKHLARQKRDSLAETIEITDEGATEAQMDVLLDLKRIADAHEAGMATLLSCIDTGTSEQTIKQLPPEERAPIRTMFRVVRRERAADISRERAA